MNKRIKNFIEKNRFKWVDSPLLSREKILELLHEKQYQDKQKKSKLKYW